MICFIYAFDQPNGQLFVQKIGGTPPYFFSKMDQMYMLP